MRRMLVPALLALAASGAVLPAQADDRAEAKRYFDVGVSLLKAEDYEGAAASFEASIEAYPTKTALFNLANCYKALKRYDDALAALFRLRRDFAGSLGEEMGTATAAIEEEIRNLVGYVKVEVDHPDAVVIVDGREIGRSPLAKPVLLSPGEHEVTARLPGVEFGVERVRMIPGQERVVSLSGNPAAAGGEGTAAAGDEGSSVVPAPPPPSAGSPPPGRLHPGWFWGALGATAALGGATIGVTAAVKKDFDGIGDQAELDRVERMQGAGIAMLALTGAAGVAATVLFFFTDWDGGKEKRQEALLPSAWADETSAAIGVSGRF